MAELQAPLLQINQFIVYLRDHLLLDKNVDSQIIKPLIWIFNRRMTNHFALLPLTNARDWMMPLQYVIAEGLV